MLFLCVLTLSACAPRGAVLLLRDVPLGAESVRSVFIATNRHPARENEDAMFRQQFGQTRDPALRFARIDISIPPAHVPGKIEWPRQAPDPARHFLARGEARYADAAAFLADLNAQGTRDEVVLFVHGYNVNNAEAVYRLAQIAHDFDAKVPVIAYSWPSAGDARGYVYDRDSVIFSRDGLEDLLVTLTGDGQRVLVVAHSMGSQLVMETLRQLSISGKGQVLGRLSGVALISPDIDSDVFVQQARRIAPFPQPFALVTSAQDHILDLSARLTGKPARLGQIRNTEALDGLPVDLIDLSEIEGGDRGGHSTAFTAPAAISLLRSLDQDL
ncbi:alpha/beta hydrolase [Tropicibacter naphthalenivorans]|uniref:alpha/beta hydrolase n=1 Tax=Tropicibacter naphthalenivorans TaxID=441103 RepID=UPI0016401762|nr:alpha/beta fold hydrolase [Tropicibacter naphthalenivorans]